MPAKRWFKRSLTEFLTQNIFNMIKKYFKRRFISSFRFDEYYALFKAFLRRAQGAAIEEPSVLNIIGNVEKHVDALDKVVERKRFHDNSKTIEQLAEKRHSMLRSLVKISNALLEAETQESRDAAAMVASFVRKERRAFSRCRIKLQDGLVGRFSAEVSNNPELLAALETLQLVNRFEEIVQATNNLESLIDQRDKEKNRLSDLAEERRRLSYVDLSIMMNTFENNANVPGESQSLYHELCTDLRSVLVSFNSAYLLRIGAVVEDEDANGKPDADKESDADSTPKNEEP